jgi:predicted ABC-type ATPase
MTPPEKPRLIVVAGPNGSGKTSITEQLLMHRWMAGCVYLNPDFIARDEFGDWNAPQAVLQAARRAAEIREQCLQNRDSLAFETVLSAPDKIEFIRRAQAAGFFIRLFFVGTDDPSINAKRVAMRVMEGGHDVPISKIISRYTRSLAACSVVAELADRAYLYDN